MNLESLKYLEIDKEHLKKVIDNVGYNDEHIVKHYLKLWGESKQKTVWNKMKRLEDCNKSWFLDVYEESKVKDFKKTNLCRDKFCNNCKKVKQASRMAKFIPLLKPYAKNMYQLTLTVPNVKGEDLESSINKLFKSFAKLTEYLKGKKKIRDVDFTVFNYKGGIRSLEVTFKKWNEYHPHIHALIVFEDYDRGKREYRNKYSKDHTGEREDRLFTYDEILIQKIWYLLTNGQKVTRENIDNLKEGYSCTLDKFQESDFVELFKYMTKSVSEDNKMMTYRHFKTLYYALHDKRQIQGYGCFFNIKDDIDPDAAAEEYNKIIEKLKEKEKPREVCETPQGLSEDTEYLLISRKKIHKHLKKAMKD